MPEKHKSRPSPKSGKLYNHNTEASLWRRLLPQGLLWIWNILYSSWRGEKSAKPSSVSSPAAVGPARSCPGPGGRNGARVWVPAAHGLQPRQVPDAIRIGPSRLPGPPGPAGTLFGYVSRAVCAEVKVNLFWALYLGISEVHCDPQQARLRCHDGLGASRPAGRGLAGRDRAQGPRRPTPESHARVCLRLGDLESLLFCPHG